MRAETVITLVKREYLSRVKTKGFWIGTLALPVVMAAMFILPALLLRNTRTDHTLVIVDATGKVGSELAERLGAREVEKKATRFAVTVEATGTDEAAQRADLDRRVMAGEINSWVWINQATLATEKSGVEKAGSVEYHAKSVSNFVTQQILERGISDVVRRVRFADAGFDPEKVSELASGVSLETLKVGAEGSKGESGLGALMVPYFLFFILFLMLTIYGQQVLNGVLEEKSSRIVEVLVSTVEPFELMMGKFLGIGLTGLTQMAIWIGTAVVLTGPAVAMSLVAMPDGALPTISPLVALHFLAFFILGFFIYATFYGALGASFNNLQEAQQAAGALGFIFVVPALFAMPVINDPDSTLAVVSSFIPPLTPLIMLLRIVVKEPPFWQIALSYVLCTAFTVFMVWVCARIYRVGILMYGKKPTFKELWRWMLYT